MTTLLDRVQLEVRSAPSSVALLAEAQGSTVPTCLESSYRVWDCWAEVAVSPEYFERKYADDYIARVSLESEMSFWEQVSLAVGRNELPSLLLAYGAVLGATEFRRSLHDAWSDAEFPERCVAAYAWVEMFEEAGYLVDGEAAPRPTEALTLYRGAHPDLRDGMSWSSSRTVAEWFRDRPFQRGAKLWTAQVDPERLYMACIGRNEHEYVINTEGLRIDEAPPGPVGRIQSDNLRTKE